MSERNRRILWAASVILAFILGYLLGRWMCAREMAASGGIGTGGVVARGDPARATPGRVKIGGGKGTASSSGGHSGNVEGGVDSANGGGANGGGGNADAGNGGGSGVMPAGSGEFRKSPMTNDSLFGRYVAKLGDDTDDAGARRTDSGAPDPNVTTRVAHDFSLDETGLPRYPNAVTRVVSSVSTRADVPADSGTGCGIETSDSFRTVVAWYHEHMPPGWHETQAADLQRVAKQLTPKNIMKMLMPADASDTLVPSDTAVPGDGGGTSLAMWSAPDNGVHGKRSVMVTASPGKPTQIVMSREVKP